MVSGGKIINRSGWDACSRVKKLKSFNFMRVGWKQWASCDAPANSYRGSHNAQLIFSTAL